MKLLVGCITIAAVPVPCPFGRFNAPKMRGRSACRPDWPSMVTPDWTSMTTSSRSGTSGLSFARPCGERGMRVALVAVEFALRREFGRQFEAEAVRVEEVDRVDVAIVVRHADDLHAVGNEPRLHVL